MYQLEEVGIEEYNKLLIKKGAYYIPLTQAPLYSEISSYLIIKESDQEVGAVSISLRKKFKGLLKYARINNGPIIFSNDLETKKLLNYIFIFLKKRGYNFIFIAPYYSIKGKDLKRFNFLFKLPLNTSGTIIISLKKPIDEIKNGLRQKWRNTLRKGIKHTKIIKITSLEDIKKNLFDYSEFANKNKFLPVDKNICLRWVSNNTGIIKLDIYNAFSKSEEFLGAIGIVSFAKTSFYLYGFTNKQGRKFHANSVLLWHAINESKSKNQEIFDLGGLNESTPLGIRRFKEGLGGKKIQNEGEFLKLI